MNQQTFAAPRAEIGPVALPQSQVLKSPDAATGAPRARFMAISKDGEPVTEISHPSQLSSEPQILWLDTECEDLAVVAETLRTFRPNAPKALTHNWLVETARVHVCANFVWIEELLPLIQSASAPQFAFEKLRLFVGKDFLITMHSPESRKIEGIWRRFLENDMPEGHYDSPSVIASVVLEECLAETAKILDEVSPYLDELREKLKNERCLPDDALSEILPHITKNMAKLEQYAADYQTIMHTLEVFQGPCEEKYGSAYGLSLAASQGRIRGLVGKVMGMIQRRETICDELRQTNDAFAQEKQNMLAEQMNYQMKDLTILGSVLAVAGLVTGVVQTEGVTFGSQEGRLILAGGLAAILGLSTWLRRRR